jgi:hypothetical protein
MIVGGVSSLPPPANALPRPLEPPYEPYEITPIGPPMEIPRVPLSTFQILVRSTQ